jgi:hypothetical protein
VFCTRIVYASSRVEFFRPTGTYHARVAVFENWWDVSTTAMWPSGRQIASILPQVASMLTRFDITVNRGKFPHVDVALDRGIPNEHALSDVDFR